MAKEVGLWIDHRDAIIVTLTPDGQDITPIKSNVGKRVRYSGASHASGTPNTRGDAAENIRDRRYDEHLNHYYDEVISHLRDADSILILGPGEAKLELQKRLEAHPLVQRVVRVETADKMTDGQIAARVRREFQKQRAP